MPKMLGVDTDRTICPRNREIHLSVKVCADTQAFGLIRKEFQIRLLELIAWIGIIVTIQF